MRKQKEGELSREQLDGLQTMLLKTFGKTLRGRKGSLRLCYAAELSHLTGQFIGYASDWLTPLKKDWHSAMVDRYRVQVLVWRIGYGEWASANVTVKWKYGPLLKERDSSFMLTVWLNLIRDTWITDAAYQGMLQNRIDEQNAAVQREAQRLKKERKKERRALARPPV